jgi:hypothetical protein
MQSDGLQLIVTASHSSFYTYYDGRFADGFACFSETAEQW